MASSPFEEVALALRTVIETEFAPEGFKVVLDNLHESLGRKRVDIGIAPVDDVVRTTSAVVQETTVEIRFYDLWTQEINPDTQINPTRITGFAHRFRNALRVWNESSIGNGDVWFYDITRIWYPNDPTGNKTRFHAQVRALGNNTGLVETSG